MSEQQNKQDSNGFGSWAIVELMGHVKMAGYVTEEEHFGVKLGRIDIPRNLIDKPITQFFGGQSVYRITPVSEEVARQFSVRQRPAPVHRWELPEPGNEDEEDDIPF